MWPSPNYFGMLLPEGWNGISDEVFLSIPVCLGKKSITYLVSQKLREAELAKV